MTTITIDKLPKDVLDEQIDTMIAANPTMNFSRSVWIKCIEEGYDIKTKVTDTATHFFLEPKEF